VGRSAAPVGSTEVASGEAPDSLASAMAQVIVCNSGSRDAIVADRRETAELRWELGVCRWHLGC
jgi:hypothetical protein